MVLIVFWQPDFAFNNSQHATAFLSTWGGKYYVVTGADTYKWTFVELVWYYEQCRNKGKGDKAKYRGPNKDAGAQKHESKVTEMRVRVTGIGGNRDPVKFNPKKNVK